MKIELFLIAHPQIHFNGGPEDTDDSGQCHRINEMLNEDSRVWGK